MYFNEMMYNPAYVNRNYYNQMQKQSVGNNFQQDIEVQKAANAVRDLCRAVKNMDEEHQKAAFFTCLGVMVQEMHL